MTGDQMEATGYVRLSQFLRSRGNHGAAETAMREAIARSPGDHQLHHALAHLLERTNRVEDAAAAVAAGLALAPHDPSLTLVGARVERRQGRPAAALARLTDLTTRATDPRVARAIQFEIGYLRDQLGNYERAYSDFVAGNQMAADEVVEREIDPSRFLPRTFTDASLWAPPTTDASADAPPVFLVGFPRSGTTLLDQVLASHPDIETLSEIPAVEGVRTAFANRGGSSLADIGGDAARRLRERYWEVVAQETHARHSARVVVDKLPLNIVHVPLIVRVFPSARIVWAVRHPLDVCLSCFMQDFELNSAMANFTSLAGTAGLYTDVMGIWRAFIERFPLRVHVVRYEQVVTNFQTEITALLDFLGVGWHDGVADFAASAARRGEIRTPSYHQVVRPLYADSIGRWRHYSEPLSGVRDQLEPVVRWLGYANERD